MRGLVILCVVGPMLSGCLAATSDQASGPEADAVGAGLGRIRGIVLDDEAAPVGDALVRLGESETITDRTGAFRFDGIGAGTYDLTAVKAGYVDARESVTVEEEDVVEVLLTMGFVGSDAPFHEVIPRSGLDGCSVYVWTHYGGQGWPVCDTTVVITGYDNGGPVLAHWIELEGVTGFWSETTWTPTQVLGSGMIVWYLVDIDDNGLSSVQIREERGTSPVAARIPIAHFYKVPAGPSQGTSAFERGINCEANATCEFIVWAFAGESSLLQGMAGLQVQQRLDNFLTVFHHGPVPHEYTALPDA